MDKKEITEITTGAPPSAPRDEDISDKSNPQHEGKDEVKRSDAPAPVDATPPVPGFGAAMTLEQYRELAKQKTYLPSTAEKAKKKAKETYEKKRNDAERKEKLGQLRELDETLSSKTNIILAPKDDEKSEKNKRNMYNNNNTNRVFGGAMTKAQKAHMAATEWEPL